MALALPGRIFTGCIGAVPGSLKHTPTQNDSQGHLHGCPQLQTCGCAHVAAAAHASTSLLLQLLIRPCHEATHAIFLEPTNEII